MLVHIGTENKREFDYILQLAESSSDTEIIRRGAIVTGEGVLYVVMLEVNPDLSQL